MQYIESDDSRVVAIPIPAAPPAPAAPPPSPPAPPGSSGDRLPGPLPGFPGAPTPPAPPRTPLPPPGSSGDHSPGAPGTTTGYGSPSPADPTGALADVGSHGRGLLPKPKRALSISGPPIAHIPPPVVVSNPHFHGIFTTTDVQVTTRLDPEEALALLHPTVTSLVKSKVFDKFVDKIVDRIEDVMHLPDAVKNVIALYAVATEAKVLEAAQDYNKRWGSGFGRALIEAGVPAFTTVTYTIVSSLTTGEQLGHITAKFNTGPRY
jgi:hypothetical protein